MRGGKRGDRPCELAAHRSIFDTTMNVRVQRAWLRLQDRTNQISKLMVSDGAQGRNRTTDTAIFSRMLYQLSYLGAEPFVRPGKHITVKHRTCGPEGT